MTIPFEQELEAWISDRQRADKLTRRESIAVFLGVRSDVIEAQAAGFSLKTIWSHMHETGRLKFRYETFLKYVRRHITEDTSLAPQASPAEPPRKKGIGGRATRQTTSGGQT